MLKSAKKILTLALACSALCWAEQMLNLTLYVTKNYMAIYALGGWTKDFYYRAAPDLYEGRYISLHKEKEDDAGRIVWALYSEKNGMLDSVIVDENGEIYSAVGRGEGGIWPPHLKHKLTQHRADKIVVAPLSIFDEVLKELHISRHVSKSDTNDIFIILDPNRIAEPDDNRETFLNKVRTYKPLMQMIKDAGFAYITIAFSSDFDENKFDYGDVAILIQDIYITLELEVPPRRERTFIQPLSSRDHLIIKDKELLEKINKILKDVLDKDKTTIRPQ